MNHYLLWNIILLACIKLYTFQVLYATRTNSKTQCSYYTEHHVGRNEFPTKISKLLKAYYAGKVVLFSLPPIKYCLLQHTTKGDFLGSIYLYFSLAV